MKKLTKRLISIVLCMCMLTGILVAFTIADVGGEKDVVYANVGNEAIYGTDKNFSTYKPKTYRSAALGSAENPFVVIEIVPNLNEAAFGYFIPGCEPISLDLIEGDYNYSGRHFRESSFFEGAFSEDVSTEYCFYENIPEDTRYAISPLWGNDAYKVREFKNVRAQNCDKKGNVIQALDAPNIWVQDPEDVNCQEAGYFQRVEDGTGNYDVSTQWTPFATVQVGYTSYSCCYKENGNYKWVKSDETPGESSLDDKLWLTRTDGFRLNRVSLSSTDEFIKRIYGSASYNAETNPNGFISKVITVTPELLSHNLNLIDVADLIYIHHTVGNKAFVGTWNYFHPNGTGNFSDNAEEDFSNHDLTNEEAIRIAKRMGSSNPAALMYDQTCIPGDNTMNLWKLSVMALLYEPAFFCYKFMDQVVADSQGRDKLYYSKAPRNDLKNGWTAETFRYDPETGEDLSGLMRMENFKPNTSVFNKIMVWSGGMGQIAFLSNATVDLINDKYNRDTTDFYDSYNSKDHTTTDALDFILGGIGSGLPDTKRQLRILEIQPCNEFIYDGEKGSEAKWKYYYRLLFPLYSAYSKTESDWMDDPKLLKVDTMTIWEFIGSTGTYEYRTGETLTSYSSDDLISKYDLIIIGSKQDATNGKNGYNDANLKNYRYTSVGDLVATSAHKKSGMATSVVIASKARYSPIDLTLKKLLELQDFAKAGKPIVVDDELYNSEGTKPDTDKVDSKSKLYEFLNGKTTADNIYVHNHIKGGQMLASLQNSMCRLELDKNGYPVEYVGDESSKSAVLVENYNPSSTLKYTFRIVGSDSDFYNVYLNIDRNGDGVYGGSLKQISEVDNMNAVVNNGNYKKDTSEQPVTKDRQLNIRNSIGAVQNGQLKANTWYTISYTLPASQRGIIPWKLEVCSVKNEKLRSSAIDYTVIQCTEESKVKINVLQMNLTSDMKSDNYYAYATYFTTDAVDVERTENRNRVKTYQAGYSYTTHSKPLTFSLSNGQSHTIQQFKKYLAPVKEFNVNIQFMYNADWTAMFGGSDKSKALENWKDFLGQYDMLIFGFQDVAMFTENEVFREGLDDYIAQGKSVIFSHDMVQSLMTNKYASNMTDAYKAGNKWLRTTSGQRSVTYELNNGSYAEKPNTSEYSDNALQLVLRTYSDYSGHNPIDPNTLSRGTIGTTYLSKLPKIDRIHSVTKNYYGWVTGTTGILETSFVKIANNGQITTYPYNIANEIEVLQTHIQNYALNLEFEESGDVNVWYNLTDNHDEGVAKLIKNKKVEFPYNDTDIYSAKDNDSRNNFYIYNKGNITYTGLGHGKSIDSKNYGYMTDDEIKLFINTMISAYRQPEGAPYIMVKNADAVSKSGSEAFFYLDYDGDNTQPLDGNIVDVGGTWYLKVNYEVEDATLNPDPNKRYYMYMEANGSKAHYDTEVADAMLGDCQVTFTDKSKGNGYELPRDRVNTGDIYTMYVPYQDIVDNNGQLAISLYTYAEYPKNNSTAVTSYAKTDVTIMYLPLFELN